MRDFDVVVVGGGHAGIEAAMAAARMSCTVALLTMDKKALGRMSCNPTIGGTAKGHLVYEVDALGGVMGEMADRTGIQFRILNKSKGPAVWSSRCQSDRELYSQECLKVVSQQTGLTILEGTGKKVLARDSKIVGLLLDNGEEISCQAIVLACGTFLNGVLFAGEKTWTGGRIDEPPAVGLSQSVADLGFEVGRLKTGTPPRLRRDSIDFEKTKVQPGDEILVPFSKRTPKNSFPFLPQVPCHLTYTNKKTHEILKKGFDRSPMFDGRIKGIGPRYCPSIETKIVRFSDKDQHQIFLEPEGLNTDLIYMNGFATSLPVEIQFEAMHTIPGLENVEMVRPGYAIEYDFFPAYQIFPTLETKKIQGLYFAGQINGTSGYEEAAAQGIVAGINAALKIHRKQPLIIKRNEAYIGVLIDDLINKPSYEPYRMFTSRAEHRLVLRQDNADRRLSKFGYEFGLIQKSEYDRLLEKESLIQQGLQQFSQIFLPGKVINEYLLQSQTNEIEGAQSLLTLCRRPQLNLKPLLQYVQTSEGLKIAQLMQEKQSAQQEKPSIEKEIQSIQQEKQFVADQQTSNLEKIRRFEKDERSEEIKVAQDKVKLATEILANEDTVEQLEIEIKYEGYIKHEQEMIAKLNKLEDMKIPPTFDFSKVSALSKESREKLSKIQPLTLGQASRIEGVTPADISVLMIYLK